MQLKSTKKVIAIIPMVLICFGLGINLSLGNGVQINEATRSNLGSFDEMLPGVFVQYGWITYDDLYNDTTGKDPSDDEYQYVEILEVYDVNENLYYVQITESGYWDGSWNDSSYVVDIIVDPDRSTVSSINATEDPYWDIFFEQPNCVTGDEILYSSDFSIWYWDYNYSYCMDVEWYDEDLEQVDPSDVNLAPEYEWAAWYSESYNDSDAGAYSGAYFDISILSLGDFDDSDRFTIFETNHFFEGLTIFNDTNGNGIMDTYFELVDYNGFKGNETQGEVESTNASESLYYFWFDNYTIGEVVDPHVNGDQIDWSVELLDLNGNLYSVSYFDNLGMSDWGGEGVTAAEEIPVTMEHLKFEYHFGVNNNLAELKVDQFFGAFVEPGTSVPLTKLDGLSLSVNYWSTFVEDSFFYSFDEWEGEWEEEWDLLVMDEELELEYGEENYTSWESDDGNIEFALDTPDFDDLNFNSVEFGGTYLWDKDGKTHDVGTAYLPMFTFQDNIYSQPGMQGNVASLYSSTTYYYSACYVNWDGYSIVHDPTYSAVSAVTSSLEDSENTSAVRRTGLIPGFTTISVLLAIGMVVVLRYRHLRKD